MVSTIRDCTTSLGCERDTGYHASTLQYIFDKYAGAESGGYSFQAQLPPRQRLTWMRVVYFYCFFMLMHLGLHVDRRMEWAGVTNGRLPDWDGLSDWTIRHEVMPIGDALAALIDEVDANWRYDPYNHAPYFRTQYTAIVDTFPVYVTGLAYFVNAELLWGAKYKRYLYKIRDRLQLLGQHCTLDRHLTCSSALG